MRRLAALIAMFVLLSGAVCAHATAPYCAPLPDGDALINENGAFVTLPGQYSEIIAVEPGKVYLAGENGDYSILDPNGQEIAQIRVSMARYTQDAVIFRWNGFYGVIDLAGKIVVYPRWTQLVSNGEGGYLALNDTPFDNVEDEVFFIRPDGTAEPTGNHTVGTLPDVLSGRMPYMASDGTYGILDHQGKLIAEAKWLYVSPFSHETAVVSDENGMGIVDADGNVILDCVYELVLRNDSVAAALAEDGTIEVRSSDGRELFCTLDAKGASVSLAGGCVALITDSASFLYSRDGRCVYRGSEKASFAEGLNRQIIVSDGEWGDNCVWLMDPDGSAASGKYQRILPLSGHRYAFLTMTGATYYSDVLGSMQRSWNYDSVRYGMIDGKGNEILQADSLEILAVEDDRFLLIREEGVCLADESGAVINQWLIPEDPTASSEEGA